MQRLIDRIYILIFGKYTLDGFVHSEAEPQKRTYIFDSVFPNEETMKIALTPSSTSIIPPK